MRTRASYNEVMTKIRPGDLIAFGGYSLFSRWAKLTTWSNVTHVASVTAPQYCKQGHLSHHALLEATVKENKKGVMVNSLKARIEGYPGDVWWLPLSDHAQQQFASSMAIVDEFIKSESGKKYDIWQLFGSAVDFCDNLPFLWRLTRNKTCDRQWFCSELIAELYNQTGVVREVNAAETTPIDLCRFSIFKSHYVQLKGKDKDIRRFNSVRGTRWGQWLTEDEEATIKQKR